VFSYVRLDVADDTAGAI